MSTTIDSLQIEIQINSTNAASGIEGLAKALKKLSKNSDISDAVTNLNDLRKSLHAFVNMPSNASKIDSLAKSLKTLSKIKVNVGDSIDSVKRSMESLGAIDVANVAPQIEQIAGALAPLNNVKGGGFNSTVNGLMKLDDVVDSLDGGSIDRFVEKIKELDEKLAPVSSRLVAIGNAFKGVNISVATASGGIKAFNTKINVTALNLTNFISITKSAVSSLRPIINVLKTAIGDALEWEGIEYQFGNSFGEQADEYYKKITEITDAMGINKQTFMEMSAMSASMLKGFGVNSTDARTMGLGYTELAYDIWAAYGNKYKTVKDASDAISSAIAGEVEPIRRAGFTIVDSQLKITAANHGLTYSTEKATEAQKSYLRYLTLVDQAHAKGIVGTYASEMDTAEGQIRAFTQQLKTLSQTFGSVFLPALVKVMPWLIAFVDLVNDAILAVANFFGVDIQPVDFSDASSGAGDYADALDSATKSAKELKNATIGIDELNVISPQTSGGSGSSGSAGTGWDSTDVGSLWDEDILGKVQFEVEEIKSKLKEALSGVTALIGGFSLVIGTLMVFSGVNIVKGLALMAVGVSSIATAVAVNWNGMSDNLAKTLTTITSVLGGFLLTFGVCLAFTGVNVPLGIGLMAAGAASLGTAVAINWKFLEGDLKNTIANLTAAVSGGLLILGAIFAFSGAAVGQGIALMVAGAAGLVGSAALNWNSIKTSIQNAVNGIKDWINTYGLLVLGVILCFTGAIPLGAALIKSGLGKKTSSGSTVGEELFKSIKSKWEEIKSWWNRNVKFKIPSLSFKVTYSTDGLGTIKKAIVNALNLPGWPKLSFAKDGGMFNMGSLIWAGEAGAEVVANAGGGRTGVMNVQQMQEAVYEGVYSAVVAAMRAGGDNGGQSVNVYLDGRQITSSVEKRQRERGATIMRNGVYAY